MRVTLARCPSCRHVVTTDDVDGIYLRAQESALLEWLCSCGTEGRKVMPWVQYTEMVRRVHDMPDSDLPYDPEEVGKYVQGFRIDLDAVQTLADVLLLWNDQARHAPWSIPQEATV